MNGRSFLPPGFAISEAERSEISTAIDALKGRLAVDAGHRKAVAVQCARLFAAFTAERLDDATARVRVEAFWVALSDKPAWAIEQTVTAILRGEEAGIGPNWSPTPPALAIAVRKRLDPILADIRTLGAVVTAAADAAMPPAEQFMVDGFADLREGLAAERDKAARSTSARFLAELTEADERARIRECEREGVDPALGVSPTLLRLLKQQSKEG